jgi:hypothetical protein
MALGQIAMQIAEATEDPEMMAAVDEIMNSEEDPYDVMAHFAQAKMDDIDIGEGVHRGNFRYARGVPELNEQPVPQNPAVRQPEPPTEGSTSNASPAGGAARVEPESTFPATDIP